MTRHGAMREGTTLGVILASCTWIWIALADAIAGQPFHTFARLGGVGAFTVLHYALNILYGIVLVQALRGSQRAPSLFIAVIFGIVMMHVAFAMLTAILAVALGNIAWIQILGGSLVGLAIATVLLNRKYPFAAHLERAEAER